MKTIIVNREKWQRGNGALVSVMYDSGQYDVVGKLLLSLGVKPQALQGKPHHKDVVSKHTEPFDNDRVAPIFDRIFAANDALWMSDEEREEILKKEMALLDVKVTFQG